MNEERDKVSNDIPAIASERARKHEHTNGPASAAFRNAVAKISTEYRLQFAWPRDGEEPMTNGKPPAGSVVPELGLGPPRKSISMGTIKPNKLNIAPVHRKRNTEADKKDGQSEAEPLVAENKNEDLREYKTEYKKKFRPFSHYDYVGGRFLQKEAADETRNEVSVPTDSTWYKEVLELRKKADEYKHRGWGVELLGESESDNKRLALWEQVLCRSSLSALSLASSTPRPGAKGEKAGKKVWPARTAWSRTTTPHQRDRSVTQNKEERSQSRVRSARDNAAKLHIRSASGRSKSVDPGISETKSPKRTPRSPVPQASTKSAKTSSEARPRPTTLTTTAPSRLKTSPASKKSKDDIRDKSSAAASANNAGQPVKKKTDASKKDAGVEKKEEEEPTSLIDEPIVKSPPEPTRVKSPEQMMMRSPEPVNWTVPLDTGKTFTVTQNVQGEALARLQGESIPASTTPPVHGQVSSGNSLSLESLEVCKIMDLSFSNDNLEHHFEPLDVSSPVLHEPDYRSVRGDNSQTELEGKNGDVSDVESCSDRSKRSPFENSVENLSDFERLNHVDTQEPEKGLVETPEGYKGDDFDRNERVSFNDSGFDKEEEKPDLSEASTPEKNIAKVEMDESLTEREQLKNDSNGNISEGYVSVDRASNELNDSFTSSNFDEAQNSFKLPGETNGHEEKFANANLHRSFSDLSEVGNRSLGKYSNDDETDSSFKLDTGHFDNLEHESIFTKEDLMSDKNNSSLDGSEFNYPLHAKLAVEKPDVLSAVENEVSSPIDHNETNDDSDSIDSVVETSVNANENLEKGNVESETSEIGKPEISKSVFEDDLATTKAGNLTNSEFTEGVSRDESLAENKEFSNGAEISSAENGTASEALNVYTVDDKNGVSHELASNDADQSILIGAPDTQFNREKIFDDFQGSEKSDNTDERYAVVSTTDFEEKSAESVANNHSVGEENSKFFDSDTKIAAHVEDNLENGLGTNEHETDLSVNSNFETSEKFEEHDESSSVPNTKATEHPVSPVETSQSFDFEHEKFSPEQNSVLDSPSSDEKFFNGHESLDYKTDLIGLRKEVPNQDEFLNEKIIHEVVDSHDSMNNFSEQIGPKADAIDKSELQTNEALPEGDVPKFSSDLDVEYNSAFKHSHEPANFESADVVNESLVVDNLGNDSGLDHFSKADFSSTHEEISDNSTEKYEDKHSKDVTFQDQFNSVLVDETKSLNNDDLTSDKSLVIDNPGNDSGLNHFSKVDFSSIEEEISKNSTENYEDKHSKDVTFQDQFNSVLVDETKSLSNDDVTSDKTLGLDNLDNDSVLNHFSKADFLSTEEEISKNSTENYEDKHSKDVTFQDQFNSVLVDETKSLSNDDVTSDKTLGLDNLDNDSVLNHFSKADFPSAQEDISNNLTEKYEDKHTEDMMSQDQFNPVPIDETKSLSNDDFTSDKISSSMQVTNIEQLSEKSDIPLTPEELKTNSSFEKITVSLDVKDSFQTHIFQGGDEHVASGKQPISVQNFFSDFKSIYPTSENLNGEQISPKTDATNFEFEPAAHKLNNL